jgi:hypothetical protein
MEPIAAGVACPFGIKFSHDAWVKGKSKRWSLVVKIGKVESLHTCDPGPESQAMAKSASGHYSRNMTDEAYERLLAFLEAGGTNCNTIRQIMRHYLPEGIRITSNQIHNMRARALKIRLEGRTLSTDEKLDFVSDPGLDWTASAAVGVDTAEHGGNPAVAGVTTGEDDDSNNFPMDDDDDDDSDSDGDDNGSISPAEFKNGRELLVDTRTSEVSDSTSIVLKKEISQKLSELLEVSNGLDNNRKLLLFGNICEVIKAARDETGIYQPSA